MQKLPIIWLFAIAFLAGCSEAETSGDGTLKSEPRPITEFSGLLVSGAYHLKWSQGSPALTIEAEQNLLPLIATSLNGTNLTIEVKGIKPTKPITISLSSAALASVSLQGANEFTASNLSGPSLKLASEGASTISLDGTVPSLEATLKGASKLQAKALQTQNTNIALAGIATAEITVSEILIANVKGTTVLKYFGNPKSVEKNVSGLGKIQAQ
jgi:uncharacterized protein YjbI with pentapeptide repeats